MSATQKKPNRVGCVLVNGTILGGQGLRNHGVSKNTPKFTSLAAAKVRAREVGGEAFEVVGVVLRGGDEASEFFYYMGD